MKIITFTKNAEENLITIPTKDDSDEEAWLVRSCGRLIRPCVKEKIMGPLYGSTVKRCIKEETMFYIHEEDGGVVGFLLWKRYKKSNEILLNKMVISKEYRGTGFGGLLVKKLKEVAESEGRSIKLRVAKINDKAIRFYKRCGFEIIEDEKEKDIIYLMKWGKEEEEKNVDIVDDSTSSSKVQAKDVLERGKRKRKLSDKQNDESRYGTNYVVRYNDVPLTVDNIFSMEDDKKEEVAKYLFDYFRSGGFPYPSYSEEEIAKDLQNLIEFDVSKIDKGDNILSCGFTTGNNIFRHFSPHFFSAKEMKSLSMTEVFEDDKKLLDVIRNRLGITFIYRGVSHPFTITGNMMRQGIRSMRLAPQTSNFRPTVAKYLYERHAPENGLVYDYSSGFNQRLLGAMAANVNIRYIGVDPWEETIEKGNLIIKRLGMEDRAKLVCSKSEDFYQDEKVDLAFSSPPYYDKEVYSDSSSQAYSNGYTSFLNDYWDGTIKNIKKMLKPTGKLILNICRKQGKHNLLDDMSKIICNHGFELEETLYLQFSKSHLTKKVGTDNLMKLEPILVFSKVAQIQ